VAHGHLDRASNRQRSASVLDPAHLLVRPVGEVDEDVVRTHQPGVAELHHLVRPDSWVGSDHMCEYAQPLFGGGEPLVLIDPGAEREGDELVGRGEMLLLQPLDIIGPFLGGTGAARIGVDRPNLRLLEEGASSLPPCIVPRAGPAWRNT
jgi:hypothetical protein